MSDYEKTIQPKHAFGAQTQRNLEPLPAQGQYKVGSTLIDQGMACDESMAPECFLTAHQRDTVVRQFEARVNDAHTSYMTALGMVRVDELLAKEPQPGLVFELLLEVVGLVAISALTNVFRALQTTAQRVVEEAAISAPEERHRVFSALGQLHDGMTTQTIKTIVGSAKKHASGVAPTSKTSSMNYLGMLADQSGPLFADIRENAPARTHSDAALLALFDAFHPSNHATTTYQHEIADILARFKSSAISKIGISEYQPSPTADLVDYVPMFPGEMVDTRVYRYNMMGTERYALFQRPFEALLGANHAHIENHAVEPTTRDKSWGWHNTPAALTDADYVMFALVPQEFEDIAIKAHVAQWGSTPTVYPNPVPWPKGGPDPVAQAVALANARVQIARAKARTQAQAQAQAPIAVPPQLQLRDIPSPQKDKP